ncbi:Kinesin light chain (KLC), partial [Durusdinium trenchii]
GRKDELSSAHVNFRGVSVGFLVELQAKLESGEVAEGVALAVCEEEVRQEDVMLESGETVRVLETDATDEQSLVAVPQMDKRVRSSSAVFRGKDKSRWTLEDLCRYHIAPESAEKDCPFVEVLLGGEGKAHVGKPFEGAYVSVPRETEFKTLVKALVASLDGADLSRSFVWLDVLGMTQTLDAVAVDELLPRLRKAVARFDQRLIYFKSWLDPAPLSSAWCVWEMLAAMPKDLKRSSRRRRFLRWGQQNSSGVEGKVDSNNTALLFAPGAADKFVSTLRHNQQKIVKAGGFDFDINNAAGRDLDAVAAILEDLRETYGNDATINDKMLICLHDWLRVTTRDAVEAKRASIEPDTAIAWFGTLLHRAGMLLESQGQHENALPLYDEALEVTRHELGNQNKRVALVLKNRALALQHLRRYEEAIDNSKEALAILERKLGADHTDVASLNNNIANCLCEQGKADEATAYYDAALSIYRKAHGEQHPKVAMTLNNAAHVFLSQGKYDQAISYCEQALRIREDKLGKNHPKLASTYANIAGIYLAQEDYSSAEEAYNKALGIYWDQASGAFPAVGRALKEVLRALQDDTDYKYALDMYEAASALKRRPFLEMNPNVAVVLQETGDLLVLKGDLERALVYFSVALAVVGQIHGEEDIQLSGVLLRMADLFSKLGREEQSVKLANTALEIRQNVLGEKHPDTKACEKQLAHYDAPARASQRTMPSHGSPLRRPLSAFKLLLLLWQSLPRRSGASLVIWPTGLGSDAALDRDAAQLRVAEVLAPRSVHMASQELPDNQTFLQGQLMVVEGDDYNEVCTHMGHVDALLQLRERFQGKILVVEESIGCETLPMEAFEEVAFWCYLDFLALVSTDRGLVSATTRNHDRMASLTAQHQVLENCVVLAHVPFTSDFDLVKAISGNVTARVTLDENPFLTLYASFGFTMVRSFFAAAYSIVGGCSFWFLWRRFEKGNLGGVHLWLLLANGVSQLVIAVLVARGLHFVTDDLSVEWHIGFYSLNYGMGIGGDFLVVVLYERLLHQLENFGANQLRATKLRATAALVMIVDVLWTCAGLLHLIPTRVMQSLYVLVPGMLVLAQIVALVVMVKNQRRVVKRIDQTAKYAGEVDSASTQEMLKLKSHFDLCLRWSIAGSLAAFLAGFLMVLRVSFLSPTATLLFLIFLHFAKIVNSGSQTMFCKPGRRKTKRQKLKPGAAKVAPTRQAQLPARTLESIDNSTALSGVSDGGQGGAAEHGVNDEQDGVPNGTETDAQEAAFAEAAGAGRLVVTSPVIATKYVHLGKQRLDPNQTFLQGQVVRFSAAQIDGVCELLAEDSIQELQEMYQGKILVADSSLSCGSLKYADFAPLARWCRILPLAIVSRNFGLATTYSRDSDFMASVNREIPELEDCFIVSTVPWSDSIDDDIAVGNEYMGRLEIDSNPFKTMLDSILFIVARHVIGQCYLFLSFCSAKFCLERLKLKKCTLVHFLLLLLNCVSMAVNGVLIHLGMHFLSDFLPQVWHLAFFSMSFGLNIATDFLVVVLYERLLHSMEHVLKEQPSNMGMLFAAISLVLLDVAWTLAGLTDTWNNNTVVLAHRVIPAAMVVAQLTVLAKMIWNERRVVEFLQDTADMVSALGNSRRKAGPSDLLLLKEHFDFCLRWSIVGSVSAVCSAMLVTFKIVWMSPATYAAVLLSLHAAKLVNITAQTLICHPHPVALTWLRKRLGSVSWRTAAKAVVRGGRIRWCFYGVVLLLVFAWLLSKPEKANNPVAMSPLLTALVALLLLSGNPLPGTQASLLVWPLVNGTHADIGDGGQVGDAGQGDGPNGSETDAREAAFAEAAGAGKLVMASPVIAAKHVHLGKQQLDPNQPFLQGPLVRLSAEQQARVCELLVNDSIQELQQMYRSKILVVDSTLSCGSLKHASFAPLARWCSIRPMAIVSRNFGLATTYSRDSDFMASVHREIPELEDCFIVSTVPWSDTIDDDIVVGDDYVGRLEIDSNPFRTLFDSIPFTATRHVIGLCYVTLSVCSAKFCLERLRLKKCTPVHFLLLFLNCVSMAVNGVLIHLGLHYLSDSLPQVWNLAFFGLSFGLNIANDFLVVVLYERLLHAMENNSKGQSSNTGMLVIAIFLVVLDGSWTLAGLTEVWNTNTVILANQVIPAAMVVAQLIVLVKMIWNERRVVGFLQDTADMVSTLGKSRRETGSSDLLSLKEHFDFCLRWSILGSASAVCAATFVAFGIIWLSPVTYAVVVLMLHTTKLVNITAQTLICHPHPVALTWLRKRIGSVSWRAAAKAVVQGGSTYASRSQVVPSSAVTSVKRNTAIR